jgi:hypothetical protein
VEIYSSGLPKLDQVISQLRFHSSYVEVSFLLPLGFQLEEERVVNEGLYLLARLKFSQIEIGIHKRKVKSLRAQITIDCSLTLASIGCIFLD